MTNSYSCPFYTLFRWCTTHTGPPLHYSSALSCSPGNILNMDQIPFPLPEELEVDYQVDPYEYAVLVPLDRGLVIFDITLLILVVVSNAFMIYFICGQKKSRTTHNITMVSIGVCDILAAMVVMPFYLVLSTETEISPDKVNPFMCKLSRYLSWWFKTVMVYSTMAMVVNRYLKLMDPRGHSFLTGRCMFYLNFVWFSAAAYNIWKIVLNDNVIYMLYPEDDRNLTVTRCTASAYYAKLRTGFLVADFTFIYLGPLTLCVVMFVRMLPKLCKKQSPQNKVKATSRIAMAALMAALLFICQLPLQIFETIFTYTTETTLYETNILNMMETLSLMQGFLNVVAFIACSKEFHKAWRDSCCCVQPDTGHVAGRGSHVLLRSQSTENVIESLSMN